MCLYKKNSQVHMFFSNFSQVHIFCNDDNSKLVPESTCSGVSWVVNVDNLMKQQKLNI